MMDQSFVIAVSKSIFSALRQIIFTLLYTYDPSRNHYENRTNAVDYYWSVRVTLYCT